MGKDNFLQRKKRVRAKIAGTKEVPRLSVFRSNKGIYAQVVDDSQGKTLVAVSSREIKGAHTKTEVGALVGEALAKKALKKKIKRVIFDRGGYKYHGRVKAVAEGARKAGLEF